VVVQVLLGQRHGFDGPRTTVPDELGVAIDPKPTHVCLHSNLLQKPTSRVDQLFRS
jgi:hypothetical protein